jgi:Cellulose binding domain
MMTPWFAASVGMVIAAAVAVDSPAALTYGPAPPGAGCSVHGCAGAAPGSQPGLATAAPGVPLPVPGAQAGAQDRGAAARSGASGAAAAGSGAAGSGAAGSGAAGSGAAGSGAGYRLGYRIVRHRRAGFVATITMPGDLTKSPWNLQFGFASARIDRVWGALWQPSGDGHGGTALGPWPSRGQPAGGTGAQRLTVRAAGTPAAPSNCTLDGIRCSFG